MITAESLFFAILGTTRAEITPSVLATEITAELLFDENLGFDDFRITKDVYPTVAKLLRRSSDSVSRSVERMTARLWRCGSPEQLRKSPGRSGCCRVPPGKRSCIWRIICVRSVRSLRCGTERMSRRTGISA